MTGARLAAAALLLALPCAASALSERPQAQLATDPDQDQDLVDLERVMTDRAHAEEMLRRLEALPPEEQRLEWLLGMRAILLAGAERPAESAAIVDRLLPMRMFDPETYLLLWGASLRTNDLRRMVATLETVAFRVPEAHRAEFVQRLNPEAVLYLMRSHDDEELGAQGRRLIEALTALGWPGPMHIDLRDAIRRDMIDLHLADGDRAAAARIVRTVTSPRQIVGFLTARKYDGMLEGDVAPAERLRAALAAHDRATAQAIAAYPNHLDLFASRARFLRSVGRSAEALALLQPFLTDIRATASAGELGSWLINEAVYALSDLGRADEARALVEGLLAAPDGHIDFISQSIDHIAVLRSAGRHAEALAHARGLQAEMERLASPSGQRWIDEGVVCALAALGRRAEAGPEIARLHARSADNPTATARALLCLGDVDAVAALIVRQLESDYPEGAILALQQYELEDRREGADPLSRQLAALRERPEVAAALARVGRSLRLPIAPIYINHF